MQSKTQTHSTDTTCYHCGDTCPNPNKYKISELNFCCAGCKTVYQLLVDNELCEYYDMESAPGIRGEDLEADSFLFLEDEVIRKSFVRFENEEKVRAHFFIPQIHCSSCIWLLEHLDQLHRGVIAAQVDFQAKKLEVLCDKNGLSLSQLVALLAKIGYRPDLHQRNDSETPKTDKTIIYKIGVAGFCFGNIMLLSFPEYLGIDQSFDTFKSFFSWLSFGLSIPVFFYAGNDYLKQAWKGFQQRFVNMDIPIALGMLTLMLRSSYEVFTGTGMGYFDSLSGLVFFLLLGKWFQQKTYVALSFERDYKSYFPIAVGKKTAAGVVSERIENLKPGDEIILRNNELIPADGLLVAGQAFIDYSFVTGESEPVRIPVGEQVFAGGRQVGAQLTVKLEKGVNNSYLVQLWNQDVFTKSDKKRNLQSISDQVSRYFTWIILGITLVTAVFWWWQDPTMIWNTVTAVLIVACPCALALSVPFTLGNSMRRLGTKGFYLKHAGILEQLARLDTIVLDKTGTLTEMGQTAISYEGESCSPMEWDMIKITASNSLHPMSMAISESLEWNGLESDYQVGHFLEKTGKGVEAMVNGTEVYLGASLDEEQSNTDFGVNSSLVYVYFNKIFKGIFHIRQQYRAGLLDLILELKKNYHIHLLSGDNDSEQNVLKAEFGFQNMHFFQKPIDKLNYIAREQEKGHQVLMVGDGLNDAGALKQSDVGIAISDRIHQFYPACDAIWSANAFQLLPKFLTYAQQSIQVIKWSFVISFLYNIVGLSFAISGHLSPVVAAILMPLSSLTVVLFATGMTNYFASKIQN